MHKLIDVVGSLLYPPRCPVCDGVVNIVEQGICGECFKKIHYVKPPRCMKCGKPIDNKAIEYCEDCGQNTHYFKEGRALYQYREVAGAIYRFKYGGRREYAKVFGEEMAYYLGDYIKGLEPDALIPVPLHITRERQRGYNQAKLLAKVLGEHLNIPVETEILRRVKKTKPLKLMNPEERINNLKKAFILVENGVKLSTIVIIDDIYTTGSTMDAIAEVFIEHGVENIYFVALAIGNVT